MDGLTQPLPQPMAAQASDFAPHVHPSRMEATALVRPPPSRTGLWIVIAVAVLLAGAFGFYFFIMPHPGRLIVKVTDAKGNAPDKVEVSVDGKSQCVTAPCIVESVSPNKTHNVKVRADGYDAPPDQTVSVDRDKEATVVFTLGAGGKKNGTGLRVSGKQVGVKLYVDGDEKGPLPQELTELAPGDHKVKIAGSDRYAPMEKNIIVVKDEMQDLGDVSLKVVKGKATINLITTGAKVTLIDGNDRRELPTLPISVDIDTSKHWTLEASKTGYDEYKQVISFEDGQAEKTFDVVLGIHGQPVPTTTRTVAQIPPTVTTTATATATATATDTSNPPAEGPAFLNINSVPPSTCFLDGRPLGPTPRFHVQTTPGSHQVKFVNSELGLTKVIGVSVGAGETKFALAKLN
jgi:serine/threonine-protein kinase